VKILALGGSPRKEGNTAWYLQRVLETAAALGAEGELVELGGLDIEGCRGCYGCVKAGKCVVEDDFQEVFQKLIEADGILFGSPVYHGSITSKLKAVMDRAGFSGRWAMNQMKDKGEAYTWKGTVFSDKVVAPVTVARRAGQNFAFAQILLWAAANDCIIVGNTYWNVGAAGKGGAKDASEDVEGVGIMDGLAHRMVETIRALEMRDGR